MSFPYHKQERIYTCGPAVMRMVLEACGIKKSEKKLIKLLHTNTIVGTRRSAFPKAAEKYGLNYHVLRYASLDDLRHYFRKRYVIIVGYLYVQEKIGHFAIVKKITKDTMYLYDPWFGPQHKLSSSYFQKLWSSSQRYVNEKRWFIAVKKP